MSLTINSTVEMRQAVRDGIDALRNHHEKAEIIQIFRSIFDLKNITLLSHSHRLDDEVQTLMGRVRQCFLHPIPKTKVKKKELETHQQAMKAFFEEAIDTVSVSPGEVPNDADTAHSPKLVTKTGEYDFGDSQKVNATSYLSKSEISVGDDSELIVEPFACHLEITVGERSKVILQEGVHHCTIYAGEGAKVYLGTKSHHNAVVELASGVVVDEEPSAHDNSY